MSTLSLSTPDGDFTAHVARPAVEPAPVVVLVHEIFGVNADLRQTADELAGQGFIVLCPDLFWRQDPGVDLDPSAPDAFARGVGLYEAFDFDAGVRDITAALEAARALPGSTGRAAVMGFCMGGLLAFLTAARSRVDAAVAYYGGGTETRLGEAGAVRDPLVLHLGEDDEYITPPAREQILAAFAGSPNVEVFTYPGQGHAFARHGGDRYDAGAAGLANGRTLAFLRQHLTG